MKDKVKICKIVKAHQDVNGGVTDLEWLDEHTKACKVCQDIMAIVTETFIKELE